LALASSFVEANPVLLQRAREIEKQAIAPLDALHLASAEKGRAEWFVTCDDRILRRARHGKLTIRPRVGTPIELVETRKGANGQS
jgi:predicted nucleic acid-binding protein